MVDTVKDGQTVLFLCTGNFYRSRYAEAWFNNRAETHGLLWKAESRGFRPHLAREDLSHHASERLELHEVSLHFTRPKPCQVAETDLAEASLVIALYEPEHRPFMREAFPRWIERVRYWNVPDIDEIDPGLALPLIEHEVDQLVRHLRSGHALGASRDALVEF